MQLEVIAMVVLGRPERGRGNHLGDDGRIVDMQAVDLGDDGLRLLALRLVLPEDVRRVLRTDVLALAARRGGVVRGEEHAQQIGIGQFFGVELDAGHFDVAGGLGADLFVGRIVDMAAGVAGQHADDAAQLLEHGLDAPKTSTAENGDLMTIGDRQFRHGFSLVKDSMLRRQRQYPLDQFLGLGLAELRLGRHGDRAPIAAAAVKNLVYQIIHGLGLAGIAFGDAAQRRADASGIDLMAGQASLAGSRRPLKLRPCRNGQQARH